MSPATRLCAFLLALLPALVFAQAVPATDPIPRVAFPLTTSGNTYTFGPLTADAANAAKFSYGVASNGAVFANTGAALPTPGGSSVPISVNGSIAKPNVSAAVGRFARKVLPLAYPLQVGSALYDLASELGYGLQRTSGDLVVTKQSDNTCSESPTCFRWYVTGYNQGNWYNPAAACKAMAPILTQQAAGASVITYVGVLYGPERCDYTNYNTSTQQTTSYRPSLSASPMPSGFVSPGTLPSSLQELEDAIAVKSVWPSSSALARSTVEAIKAGESLQVEPQSITGPSSSPGSSSTTTDPVNNTTTVTTTTHNYNYAGATVTVTTTTNNTTTNNATNSVVNSSTTTSNPELPKAQETPAQLCGIPGTPACSVKVDEQGTPEYDANKFKLPESLKTDTDAHLEKVKGSGDKTGMFDNMRSLFSLPPIMECGPINLPSLRGMELGQLDPCAGVEWLRGLMGFVWAAVGFMFCWGCVKEAI